jgi:DNA-binding NtrC family response regulator
VEDTLRRAGCAVEHVGSLHRLWDLVWSDLDLVVVPCESAPHLLGWIKTVCPGAPAAPPVLTLAGATDVAAYLRAMALGAFDCVALPVDERELHRVLERALATRREVPLLSAV